MYTSRMFSAEITLVEKSTQKNAAKRVHYMYLFIYCIYREFTVACLIKQSFLVRNSKAMCTGLLFLNSFHRVSGVSSSRLRNVLNNSTLTRPRSW